MRDSALKRYLLGIWDEFSIMRKYFGVQRKCRISIMTSEKTIQYILKKRCSIARYGDGEFGLMLQRAGVGYQRISPELAESLKNVFENQQDNLLICLPAPMISQKGMKKESARFWKVWAIENNEIVMKEIRKRISNKYIFGDSFISRPYSGYKTSRHAEKIFAMLKKIWEKRDILIVEGEQTRMGIGNDLFDNASSVKRIIAPSENAFSSYKEIYNKIVSLWNGELVLMALGPTATVLASDLSKEGIQALDLGHLDIQYEWSKSGKVFTAVSGKYTNEAVNGRENIINCTDEDYTSQICAVVK